MNTLANTELDLEVKYSVLDIIENFVAKALDAWTK